MSVDVDNVIKKIVEVAGISEEEVRERINKKIKAFSGLLTETGAAYAVAKELGVDITASRELSQRVSIRDLKPGMERVDVLGRILRIFPPNEFKKDGKTGKYCGLIIGDETGIVRLTLWNRDVSLVEKGKLENGQMIEVVNGYVREYKGEPVLALSFESRIVVKDDADNDSFPKPQNVPAKVEALLPNMKNVDIVLKIMRCFPAKAVKRDDGEIEVRNIIGADETGSVRVVLWGDRAKIGIKEGDVVKIISGYTKEGSSGVEVHVGRLGIVQLKEGFEGLGGALQPTERKHTSELKDGDKFVEVRGTAVRIFKTKPISAKCKNCDAKAEWKEGKWVCPQCGGEDVRITPILTFELDDGTGSIRVIAFDRQAEKIYGENLSPDVDLHSVAEGKLLGEEIVVSGYVRKNEYFDNLEIVAKVIREPNWDYELKRAVSEVERALGEKGK